MTTEEINAAQKALRLLYDELMAKGLATPEIKVIMHQHMNRLTIQKK
jgi:hypothetical protein